MGYSPILIAIVALVGWTLAMQAWLFATRLPALRRKGIRLKGLVGGQGRQLDGVVEDHVQWKAHNYNHLMEQPTLFYAIAIVLALIPGAGADPLTLGLAWAYVTLRILHSLIQATVNIVRWRFLAFTAASLVLLALTVRAVLSLWS